jgi:hypothetical protein
MKLKHYVRIVLFCILSIFYINPSFAWVYPEHRQISLLAIQRLNPSFRALLDRLWAEARSAHTSRLTEWPIDTAQGRKPRQLDYAAWAAIAGDHSCSPKDLLNTVLNSDWILKVADVAALLQTELVAAQTNSKRVNVLRDSDMRFMRADLNYATRAGANTVHFLLARNDVKAKGLEFLRSCIAKGADLNGLGAYAWFHMSALEKMSRYSSGQVSGEAKTALLLGAFADEAFAAHFLQDAFAAGHVAGTWGGASLTKGTHDYYNEKGLEAQTWQGNRMVLMGDAYMRPQDAAIAAVAVGNSLEQLLDAAAGKPTILPNSAAAAVMQRDTFNLCSNFYLPEQMSDTLVFSSIIMQTPLPGLANGPGAISRVRAELGPFFGVSASLNGTTISGGFGAAQSTVGGVGGLEANVGFGVGLDGVLNQSGDGLMFLQMGFKQDAASSNNFANIDPSTSPNAILSTIPARMAYNLRIRMPFWLIPGDLILGAPLLLFAPKAYQKMAVTAANGGLIPWQSGIASPIGRFQFMLGREVGVSLYGLRTPQDFLIIPVSKDKLVMVEYRSTRIDLPFLEYRPLRSFSQNQSSSFLIQFTTGVDIPSKASVLLPVGDPVPQLKNIYYLGMRIMFDWRRYL